MLRRYTKPLQAKCNKENRHELHEFSRIAEELFRLCQFVPFVSLAIGANSCHSCLDLWL